MDKKFQWFLSADGMYQNGIASDKVLFQRIKLLKVMNDENSEGQ
jgi:hypothetical protein